MRKFIIALLSFIFVIGNLSCRAQNDEIELTVNDPIVSGNRIEFSMSANTETDSVYVITALYDENNVLSAVKANDLNGHFDVKTNKKYMMKIFVTFMAKNVSAEKVV